VVFIVSLLPVFLGVPAAEVSLPERVVSLVPAVTEQLFLLGAEDRLVGVTTYCTRPPRAQAKDTVGTIVDVNVEKILALHPDLIIASPLTERRQLAKLKELDLTVKVFPNAANFGDLCDIFLAIAHVVDAEPTARRIVARERGQLKEIQKRMPANHQPDVFVQIGAHPLFTSGRDTVITAMITAAGGRNIAADVTGPSLYSRETVIRKDPDIIILVTMGVAEQEARMWRRYPTIRAVRMNQVHILDPYPVCSPTPITFVDTVQKLARIFHGI
jgi:iron complex transport system substrate-binding protein